LRFQDTIDIEQCNGVKLQIMVEPYDITLFLDTVGERYAQLRIVQPSAEKSMERSMQRHGQLTPVVVGKHDAGYEMVDGFKRLRAGRRLGYQSLSARVMVGGQRAMKAAIIYLNSKARTIADIESALVIRSLYRQDHLSQVEIAALLDRHKSFVCRRLQLVERLSDEVLEHLKIGLINITIGRELARLPAGNQTKALTVILKYGFTGEECVHLVSLLLRQPQSYNEKLLCYPEPILIQRNEQRPRKDWCRAFCNRLIKMDVYLSAVTYGQLNTCQKQLVLPAIERLQSVLTGMRGHLMR
jgi:ParB/RepB/Spo0J family partition protein